MPLTRSLLLLLPVASALQAPDFQVPSVDFSQLSNTVNNAHNFELLANLQENGIIALRNVPKYAALRQEYLRTAAACAVEAQQQGAEFLLHRQLRDGTNRYTVSLESGYQLTDALDQNPKLLSICPEYVEIHAAFSAVVEFAVAVVGTALDATQEFNVMTEHGTAAMTARQLLEESVHLDHFHAYEAVKRQRRLEDESEIDVNDMTLELHTDNGLMIAMTAPEYFEVASSGTIQDKDTLGHDAGLVIKTAKGEIVRPVLKADELILMIGSGINTWIQTTPPLSPVLHGMRYPRGVSLTEGSEQGTKLLRSWFGKMILLQAHQTMDNTGLTFGQYANQTTRYLVEQVDNHQGFAAVACPPQRRLVASANSCSLKTCSLKDSASASDLPSSCQVTCNHDSSKDAALCEKYCNCSPSTNSATMCWMLCVENVPSSACPGEQVCNTAATKEQLAMKCVAGPVAPPTASAPAPPTASAPAPPTASAPAPPTASAPAPPTASAPAPPTASAPAPPTASAPTPPAPASGNGNANSGTTSTPSAPSTPAALSTPTTPSAPSAASPPTTPSTETAPTSPSTPSTEDVTSTSGTLIESPPPADAPVTTASNSTEPSTSSTEPTSNTSMEVDSNALSSSADADATGVETTVGDNSTTVSATEGNSSLSSDDTSSSSAPSGPSSLPSASPPSKSRNSPSTSRSSSATKAIPLATYVNGISILLALFLSIK